MSKVPDSKNKNNQNKKMKPQKTPNKNNRSVKLVTFIIFILLFFFIIFNFLINPISLFSDLSSVVLSIIPSLLSFYLFSYSNIQNEKYKNNEIYENIRGSVRFNSPQYSSTNQTTEDCNESQSADILELMLANMKEIQEYYGLSKAQAKNSFFLTVIMCLLGFILLGVSIVTAITNKDNIVATIIPAVSGAIVELIAGTSLIVYRNSQKQLNHYYSYLHDNERFLSTVNIVNKLNPEKRDEMYKEIIRSQIHTSSTKK